MPIKRLFALTCIASWSIAVLDYSALARSRIMLNADHNHLDAFAADSASLAESDKIEALSGKAAGWGWPLNISISDSTAHSDVIEVINGLRVEHRCKDTVVISKEPTFAQASNTLYFFQACGSLNMFWIDPCKINITKSASIKSISGEDAS